MTMKLDNGQKVIELFNELYRVEKDKNKASVYKFTIKDKEYCIHCKDQVFQKYCNNAVAIMNSIEKRWNDGILTKNDIHAIDDQIAKKYEDEEERNLWRALEAKSQGLIDDSLQQCLWDIAAVNGISPDSASFLLLENPVLISLVVSVMDVFLHGADDDLEFYYNSGVHFIVRVLLSRREE